MADSIQIKATEAGSEPKNALLNHKELGFHTDEEALYIGYNGRKNIKLCQASDVGRVAEKVDSLPEDANLGEVISAFNSLLLSLKNSGLMKT